MKKLGEEAAEAATKKPSVTLEIVLRNAKGAGGAAAPGLGSSLMSALYGLGGSSGRGDFRTQSKAHEIAKEMGVSGPMSSEGKAPAYDWMKDELIIPAGTQDAAIAHEMGHKKLHDLLGKAFSYASGASRLAMKLAPVMGAWAASSKEPTSLPGLIQAILTTPMLIDEAGATAQALYHQVKQHGLQGLAKAWPLVPALGTYASNALMPLAIGKMRQLAAKTETTEAEEAAAKVAAELHCIERLPGSLSHRKGITEADVDKKQLEMGTKVEREHTSNESLARRIALDHLGCESPMYYTWLKRMEERMPKTADFYHGSPRKLDVLDPRDEHGDTDTPKVVFASPSRNFALAYAGKKWGDRDMEQGYYGSGPDRPMVLREMRPNAFKDIFDKKRGYLYHLPEAPFHIDAKRKCLAEQWSPTSVVPNKVEEIMDTLKALQAEKEKIQLIPYNPNAESNRIAVRRSIKRMQGMPDKGVGYLRWRLAKAPPEIKQIFKEELAAARLQAKLQGRGLDAAPTFGVTANNAAAKVAAELHCSAKKVAAALVYHVATPEQSVPLEAPKQADDKVIRLPGSLSRREGVNVGDVDKKQLEMGVKVEREHVAEKPLARGISLDHLAEIPDYYTRLKKMEAEAKKGA